MTKDEIIKQARKELEEELFREAVDKEKERILSKKWWHKLLPYKIVLIRR
jgi:hypothetical protein